MRGAFAGAGERGFDRARSSTRSSISRWIDKSTLLALGAVILTGCSGAGDAPSEQPAAVIAEARALTPAEIEAKAGEISQNDYRMLRSLMAAGGLDEELGGAAQGDAALRQLMVDFRTQALGYRAELPRIIKIADNDAPGLAGLGMSFFAGLMTQGGIMSLLRNSSEAGSFDRDGFKASVDDRRVSTETTFEGKVDGGLTGRITTKTAMNYCPGADGAVRVEMVSDSALTSRTSSAGANVKVTANLIWYVTDDAEFGNQLELDIRVENAAFGGARGANGAYVDYAQTMSSLDAAKNGGVFNRVSSRATADDRATAQAAAEFARSMVITLALQAKDVFQSGKCVKLEVTSDPAKRTGAKPKTSFAILAKPRSKTDGTPTGGTVQATLSGAGALDPAGAKVPADAKFTYVAGDKDTKGTVSFEARSKRGIGRETATFDTLSAGYRIVGGGGEFRGEGTTCDLAQPFEVRGNANIVVKFAPADANGGSYTYTGNISGARLSGKGTYKVQYEGDKAVRITASGPGSACTPVGCFTNQGSETYTLTPQECGG